MTTQTEALKLALEALIGARAFLESDAPVEIWSLNDKAIAAIKEALSTKCVAQPDDTAKLYEELRSIIDGGSESFTHDDAVQYLKDKLAQPEQEPVAWWIPKYKAPDMVSKVRWSDECEPLYTTPPQRTWVGLDPEEIRKTDHHMVDGAYHYSFKQGAEWAEAKLKEKNT